VLEISSLAQYLTPTTPQPDSDLSEEEAMMQAIAMSLAVEEEGAHPAEEKEPEEPQPEIEYVTEDKLWSLYDKILGELYFEC